MKTAANSVRWLDKSLSIESFYDYKDGHIIVHTHRLGRELCGMWDIKKDEFIIPVEYNYLEHFRQGLARVRQKGAYSVIDQQNETVISAEQYYIPDIHDPGKNAPSFISDNGLIRVGTLSKERRWGFVDKTGKPVVDLIYEDASDFSSGMAFVSKDGLFGYINEEGTVVVPCRYEDCKLFEGEMAVVSGINGDGAVNIHGREVIPAEYDLVYPYWGGRLAGVLKDDKWGVISMEGEEIVPLKYSDFTPYEPDGCAMVGLGGMCGLIDGSGKLIVPAQYLHVGPFKNGFAEVSLSKRKKTYIDIEGREMKNTFSDLLMGFSDGLAAVKVKGKWGFCDEEGSLAIPAVYEEVSGFRNGIALVRNPRGGMFGAVDTAGNPIIPMEYDWMFPFDDGRCTTAKKGEKYGLIDRRGEPLVPFEYQELFYVCDAGGRYALVRKDDSWGIMEISVFS